MGDCWTNFGKKTLAVPREDAGWARISGSVA